MMEDIKTLDRSNLIQRQTAQSSGGLLLSSDNNYLRNPQSYVNSQSNVDEDRQRYKSEQVGAPVGAPAAGFGEIIVKDSKTMNVCQWICFGILLLTFMFLFSFIIYQSITWNKVRINRYG